MTDWLTLAAVATATNRELATLQAYLDTENPTPEEQFQQLGYLFDRDRWQSGQTACWQALPPAPSPDGEPYEFDHCTVQIAITLLPQSAAGQRQVLLAATTHQAFPVVASPVWLSDLEPWPEPIAALLATLKAELTQRQLRQQLAQRPSPAKPTPAKLAQPKAPKSTAQPDPTTPIQISLL